MDEIFDELEPIIENPLTEAEQALIKQQWLLRKRREKICFNVINRGQVWYNTLTPEQKAELQTWYEAWLNVTTTLAEPIKPEWLH